MDDRDEARKFLASRRAKLTPQQAGLPALGGDRRVPGLRREEVALLADVRADSGRPLLTARHRTVCFVEHPGAQEPRALAEPIGLKWGQVRALLDPHQ